MKYHLLIGTAKEPGAVPTILLKIRSFKAVNRAFKQVRDEGNFYNLETVEIEYLFGDNLGHKIEAIRADRLQAHEANRKANQEWAKEIRLYGEYRHR